MKVGLGFDVHAFGGEGELILGGLKVEGPPLAGRSDADVLSHAVADAVLGAAGLGDLGTNFPESEVVPGTSSIELLSEAVSRARQKGLTLSSCDATVIAQSVKLNFYSDAMAAKLAEVLGAPEDAVTVKATTTDGLGFTGRDEGIAAIAVVLMEQQPG